MQDTHDMLSGNELDDSGYGGDPETAVRAPGSGPHRSGRSGQARRRRVLQIAGLLIAVIMAAAGGVFLAGEKPDKRSAAPAIGDKGREPVRFESFVIPFTRGGGFSYIHIGVSFGVDREETRQELGRKKNVLRGRIYDRLREETVRNDRIPLLENLKQRMLEVVNDTLVGGKIDRVYITHFLIV